MKTIQINTAKGQKSYQGIIDLQKKNLPQHISSEEAKDQGFVTLEHDMLLLEKMNSPFPHIIATNYYEIVGYALVMLREFKEFSPLLSPIVDTINSLSYQGNTIINSNYFIMGQVCIDKSARGQGLFKRLYDRLEDQMKTDFDYMITVISCHNPRSIRAHEKVGFETIHIDTSEGRDWVIVLKKISC